MEATNQSSMLHKHKVLPPCKCNETTPQYDKNRIFDLSSNQITFEAEEDMHD